MSSEAPWGIAGVVVLVGFIVLAFRQDMSSMPDGDAKDHIAVTSSTGDGGAGAGD